MKTIPLLENKIKDGKKVYAIEGLNGVGKSTLIGNLKRRYKNICTTYCVPEIFMEPKDLKHFVLDHKEPFVGALYYFSGLVAKSSEIKKIPEDFVILDRSIWSTVASAYSKDQKTASVLMSMLQLLNDKIRIPDRVIVLKASFESCLERIRTKCEGQEFDKDTKRDFEMKSEFYDVLAQSGYPVTFVRTDGNTAEDTFAMVSKIISE